MSLIFQDTFVEVSNTELSLHSPVTGDSWVSENENGSDLKVSGNNETVAAASSSGGLSDGAIYSANGDYWTADYDVQVLMKVGDASDETNTIACRWEVGGDSGYALRFNNDGMGLYRVDSGTVSSALGTDATTISDGTTVWLRCKGTTISAGTGTTPGSGELISVTDSTYTDAGRAAIGMGTIYDSGAYSGDDLSAQELDDFEVNSVGDVEQEGFAFGDDNDSESAHDLDAQDTNVTEPLGTKTLRMLANATGDPASIAYQLYSRKNGTGAYTSVGVGSTSIPAVTYVGGTSGTAENGGDVALTLSNITGLQEDDIVILAYGIADNDGTNFDMGIATGSGWTEVADLHAEDNYDCDLGVYWKIMGATPDTSVTVDGQGGNDASVTAIAMAFRGVDTTTPMDVTPTTAETSGTSNPNPPSIDHNGSTGTAVVAIGAASNTRNGETFSAPAGYALDFITVGQGDSSDGTLGMGYNLSPSDPEDPPAMTIASDSALFSSCAVTIALRAAAGSDNEVYISTSANVATGGEDTTARLTAPSGKTSGSDFDTGRRWDDENGSDSIDITTDDYTELEWVLTTQSPAATDDYFEFRLYSNDLEIPTYTVTPKWTIGEAAAATFIPRVMIY